VKPTVAVLMSLLQKASTAAFVMRVQHDVVRKSQVACISTPATPLPSVVGVP
jgi:hypothetical protein